MRQRQHSYTSNSKISKLCKKIAVVLSFLFVFLCIEYVLGELLNPGTYKSNFHPRLRWEDYYSGNKNVDMVFLGSSHAYRSFDPHIFETKLGLNAFNMGSSNQNPIDSYYVLRELLRYHKPKIVILEQYYVLASYGDTDFNSATYNFDYMKFSLNKLQYMFNAFQPKEYLKAIFKSVRYKDNWNKADIWSQNLKRIKTRVCDIFTGKKEKTTYSAAVSGEIYRGKGYVSNDGVVSYKELFINNKFKGYTNLKFNKKRLDYDNRIIRLCKKNNIKILLITAPFPPESMKFIKNYGYIHQIYQQIADKDRVNYIDYNYINNRTGMFKNNNFKDSDHLNSSGVKILDNDIIKYIKNLD